MNLPLGLKNCPGSEMKSTIRSHVSRAALALALVFVVSISAAAQTQVRVIRNQATIWRRDAAVPATTVKAGTVLDVVGRDGDWFIVLVPPEYGGSGETGRIAALQVEAIEGSPERTPAERAPVRPSAPGRRPVVAEPHRAIEVFGSGEVGLNTWLARDTFAAVLGSSTGPVVGAGVEVRMVGHIFVQVAVERFEATGQRVFVSNGQVFNLGIADTVRVIPVSVTAGYRHDFRTFASYFGGGAGRYFYKETSDPQLADPSENLDERVTSYHVLAGFEFGGRGPVRTAFEVQFTSVPNGLGANGASAAFNERNLGGVQVRLKILAGR